MSAPKIIPPYQWTHDGDRVLILKCVSADMVSHGGFVWPTSGDVTTPNWSPEPTCESGGFFGWPWGVGMGGGKEPDYTGRWVVFAAKPTDVVSLDDKCKAGPTVEVVFVGTWYAAWSFIRAGHIAWVQQASRGAASSTGDRGAASSTGSQGAASSTGSQGAASSTGYQGAASSTGYRGAASSTGDRGAASSTGYQGAASSTGYRGAASSTGDRGAASSTGDLSTVEAGNGGIAACTADECYWRVRAGAVFVQRWATYKADGSISKWHTFSLDSTDHEEGVLLHIKNGKVVK